MSKIRNLIISFLVVMTIMIPLGVKADDLPETGKEPVKIYMFRGETCSYCHAALEWLDSIEEEYGDYFDLVDYEVWQDTENKALMDEVAATMGDTASGVPYIIVGKYSYPNGFAADSTVDSASEVTMGDQLIERILEVYESDDRYDVMEDLNNKPNYDNVVGVVAVIVIVGLAAVVVIARRQNS